MNNRLRLCNAATPFRIFLGLHFPPPPSSRGGEAMREETPEVLGRKRDRQYMIGEELGREAIVTKSFAG